MRQLTSGDTAGPKLFVPTGQFSYHILGIWLQDSMQLLLILMRKPILRNHSQTWLIVHTVNHDQTAPLVQVSSGTFTYFYKYTQWMP